MTKIIRLSDLDHVETPKTATTRRFDNATLLKARKALSDLDLRFDNETGRMLEKDYCIEQQSDFVPHRSLEQVMRWEFSRHISNQAWKLTNPQ